MNVDFERACSILREGHALIFPTDTVVGIGIAVEHADGFDEVFAAKRRSADKPLAWLVGGPEALDEWGDNAPAYARILAEAFWPGAVTLVIPQRGVADRTLGLRMPASASALDLIAAVGSPLATTSANFSGQPAPATIDELDPAFARDHPVLAIEEDAPSAVASTVIDCTGSAPRVLRTGTITASDIEEVLAHAH